MHYILISRVSLPLCEEQTENVSYSPIFPSNLHHTCGLPPLCHHQFTDRESSLVAMDFSGKSGGQVIQNPHEAQNAEQEEGQHWRVCMCSRETYENSFCEQNSCYSAETCCEYLPDQLLCIYNKQEFA